MAKSSYASQYAAAKKDGKLRRLAPKLIKFEEGMVIIGRYVDREVVKSKNEEIPDSYRYVVDTDEGLVSFFTSNAFDRSQGGLLKHDKVYAFENHGKIPWKETQSMWDIAVFPLDNDEDDEEEEQEEES